MSSNEIKLLTSLSNLLLVADLQRDQSEKALEKYGAAFEVPLEMEDYLLEQKEVSYYLGYYDGLDYAKQLVEELIKSTQSK